MTAKKLDHRQLSSIIRQALAEDIGDGDITTENIIPPTATASAAIIARERGIVCGLSVVKEVFKQLDRDCVWRARNSDGDRIKPGRTVGVVTGSARAILTGERVALNFLQHMSGVATATRRLVDAIRGRFDIYDTRKTHPGLRMLERYAVVCGGGRNHRLQLDDMVLVKDNHLLVCKYRKLPIDEILRQMKNRLDYTTSIEIECCNFKELRMAMKVKPDVIMLDNMPYDKLRRAVRMIREQLPKTLIEVSGKMDERKIAQCARLHIDYVSVGSITHSARDLDFSLEITG